MSFRTAPKENPRPVPVPVRFPQFPQHVWHVPWKFASKDLAGSCSAGGTVEAALESPACADRKIPPNVFNDLGDAGSLIDQAETSTAREARRLHRKARHLLRRAARRATHAAKEAKLSAECAAALSEAAVGLARDL
jgi:hypothetical protein